MRQKAPSLKLEDMVQLEAITDSQKDVFQAFKDEYNLVLSGSAGTGKTFTALGLALEEVLDKETPYDKVIIVRSIVPTRDIGFLPGDEEEKKEVYALPYKSICTELFQRGDAWEKLVTADKIEFMSTSFIRGITLANAIIVVDELQNLNGHELDSVITRVGENCRIMFCGDYYQSDFKTNKDRDGVLKFLDIVNDLNMFKVVEFTWKDIVRSGLVRDYIMTKEMKGIKF